MITARFLDLRRRGVVQMRLLTFLIVTVLSAVAAFLISISSGTTVGTAIVNAIITLVALQFLYAAFLGILAALSRGDRKPPRD